MSTTQASYTFGCATSEPATDGDFDDWTGLGVGLIEPPERGFPATWQRLVLGDAAS